MSRSLCLHCLCGTGRPGIVPFPFACPDRYFPELRLYLTASATDLRQHPWFSTCYVRPSPVSLAYCKLLSCAGGGVLGLPRRVHLPGSALLPLQMSEACAWRLPSQVAAPLCRQQVSSPAMPCQQDTLEVLLLLISSCGCQQTLSACPGSHAPASAWLHECPLMPCCHTAKQQIRQSSQPLGAPCHDCLI